MPCCVHTGCNNSRRKLLFALMKKIRGTVITRDAGLHSSSSACIGNVNNGHFPPTREDAIKQWITGSLGTINRRFMKKKVTLQR